METQLAGIRLLVGIADTRPQPTVVRHERLPEPSGGVVTRAPWPLVAVLAVQAGLSLRLVWSNTAFPDEALYLWSGHLEWQHWTHGTPVPDFATYFSGAPVVYPPIGAAADALGGLAAARVLSMIFMLASTALLYSLTRHLLHSRAATFAAGIFAAASATQFLGSFATYDAMALALLALATWLGVRSALCRNPFAASAILSASALTLALADAAKYAAALFDPVVIGVTILAIAYFRTTRRAIACGALALMLVAATLAVGICLGGHDYWHGITFTTLGRPSSGAPAVKILSTSIQWVGIVLGLAIAGAAAIWTRERSIAIRLMSCLLVASTCLVPVEQARIHVSTSLFKHVGFGAWFGSVVAGYALAALLTAVPRVKRTAALHAACGAVALSTAAGAGFAQNHFTSWPDSAGFIGDTRGVLAHHRGPILATDDGQVVEYYLPGELNGTVFYGLWFFRYQDPETGRYFIDGPAYADAIKHRYFLVIALSYSDTIPMDDEVTQDMERYGGYRLVATASYRISSAKYPSAFKIWVREPAPRLARHHDGRP
jgi:hypothetical protein